jgi:hypothetical protein
MVRLLLEHFAEMVTVVKCSRYFTSISILLITNTIQLWEENFRMNASALKMKPPVNVCTGRLPQNTEAARQYFIRSPRLSARRHSVALALSDRSMRRILHKDLNFHLYKMVVAQELRNRDMVNNSAVDEHLIGILSNDVIILTDEAHFHLSGCVNKQNFRY